MFQIFKANDKSRKADAGPTADISQHPGVIRELRAQGHIAGHVFDHIKRTWDAIGLVKSKTKNHVTISILRNQRKSL